MRFSSYGTNPGLDNAKDVVKSWSPTWIFRLSEMFAGLLLSGISEGSGQIGHHIEDVQHYHQTRSILDESAKPQIMFSCNVFVRPTFKMF